jgi:hypothetical protein
MKEREEAERRFCRTFNSSGSAPLVQLYNGLMKEHDLQISVPILQPTSLRSKLISTSPFLLLSLRVEVED